eukprot:4880139-Prorocentrum_lima.AAC.1
MENFQSRMKKRRPFSISSNNISLAYGVLMNSCGHCATRRDMCLCRIMEIQVPHPFSPEKVELKRSILKHVALLNKQAVELMTV